MEDENIKARVIALLSYLGLSQGKFEVRCGFSKGFVNKITDGLGVDKLRKIHRAFPEVNLMWLITGEGEMINSPEGELPSSDRFTDYLEEKNKELEKYNKWLNEENKRLISENAEFRTRLGINEASQKAI